MSKVVYRGKERTHVTVGAGGMFDFADPQAAWDSITDSSIAKPYLIELSPGIYEQASPSAGEPAWAFRGKTDISIVGSRAAILRKTTQGGGTVGIGASGSLSERIRLDGFTIINPMTGAIGGGGGSPPEGALYIGDEGQHPTTLPYDEIELVNLRILGTHDGLQIFGTEAPSGGPAVTPRVWVRNNLMESRHDVYTIKGGVRLRSSHNQIHGDSGSTFGGYLTTIADWKTTGIHYNHAAGIHIDDAGRGDAFSMHTGEQITITTNGNIQAGDQEFGVGILNYLGGSGMMSYPQRYLGCSIVVRNLFNEAVELHGIACDRARFADGEFIFTGGLIDVRNESTGAGAPGTVSGVSVVSGSTVPPECRLRIYNTFIQAINDKAASNAYSMQAHGQAANEIKHGGIHAIAAQGTTTSTGGLVTYANPVGHA